MNFELINFELERLIIKAKASIIKEIKIGFAKYNTIVVYIT